MIRDFSENSKNEFKRIVREVQNEEISPLLDIIGDFILELQNYFGLLYLEEDLSNVKSYHKKMIDMNDTTVAEIDKIFSNVYSVETQFHLKLKADADSCKDITAKIRSFAEAIKPKSFSVYVQQMKQQKANGVPLSEIIATFEFEAVDPELVKKVNTLLKRLPESYLLNVKFIVYTAEEPYRSIYLNELESYTLGNLSGSDTGYFFNGDNKINVDMAKEPNNPRGPYTTFFHESGHAIDYNYNDDGRYYSQTYRNAKGQSLQELIFADVGNDMKNTISQFTSDPNTQQRVYNYIMGADQSKYSSLSKADRNLVDAVAKYYKNDLGDNCDEAGSDVYGGVTNNIVYGGYWHPAENYWYDTNHNCTGAVSRELWAEYYAASVTGNEAALQSIREHFPQASKLLDEMAKSMI